MTVTIGQEAPAIPFITPGNRRRSAPLFDHVWVRNMRGPQRPLPDGTRTVAVDTVGGPMAVHVLDGEPGKGTVVFAHPHRRYAGHWFVKTGWIDALRPTGRTLVWFDQRGYGTGTAGSPYLGENLLAVAAFARDLDDGPVDVVGQSLGAFLAGVVAPYMPWVRRIVMESPYATFTEWYADQPWSAAKFAANAFGRLSRNAHRFDTRRSLPQAPQELLVAASEADTVTSFQRSRTAIGDHPATWVHVQDRDHLDLWADPTYRAAVLEFLA